MTKQATDEPAADPAPEKLDRNLHAASACAAMWYDQCKTDDSSGEDWPSFGAPRDPLHHQAVLGIFADFARTYLNASAEALYRVGAREKIHDLDPEVFPWAEMGLARRGAYEAFLTTLLLFDRLDAQEAARVEAARIAALPPPGVPDLHPDDQGVQAWA